MGKSWLVGGPYCAPGSRVEGVEKQDVSLVPSPHVCSDQQAAELSAFVVTWTTDRITSVEVYWQPCILTQK